MGLQVLKRLAVALPLMAGAPLPPNRLPEGSVVDPPADVFPAQRLAAEQAGGRQSFMVALGNTAFSSPLLFGEVARGAGLSCNSCHINGHVNRAFFIPGLSARPGGLDPTAHVFAPEADDGAPNHTDIPSLRGIRHLGPYGRDGRIGSLREFTRHVIVEEFAGPEPAPLLLDALVAYQNEFLFLPNPRLGPLGRLAPGATEEEREGERLFRERRGEAGLSCADCHRPEALFNDNRLHDVGTGGVFRTPTLLNANSSAPYGHDGRWPDYAAAVDDLSRTLGLGLTPRERGALLAYLDAVGDAEEAEDPPGFAREMAELATYVQTLETTLRRPEPWLTRFVVDTLRAEFRRVARAFPEGEAAHQARRPDRIKRALDWEALHAGLEAVANARDPEAGLVALDAYYELAGSMVANYPQRRRP
jgi:cytochrome c peroxidase